eukprot:TRINITY_DN4054_c0_g1_i1.p1 TRINITY_DN4054_c0_g1~~TRINITY_DN4054_c0_g1_i1.p1  ORF type:complete len:170 (+),score=40.20 TRINITY_DN4054_c0_g1_i1:47-556(+)
MLRRLALVHRRACSKVVTAKPNEEVNQVAKEDNEKESTSKLLWEDHDTAADIKKGEAVDGFEDVQILPEHYEMAVRALIYGTALAFIFVGGSSVIAMKYFGFNSLREVAHYIKTSPERKPQAEIQHTIDLFQPSTWSTAWEAIIDDLKKLEEIERMKAKDEASSKASAA